MQVDTKDNSVSMWGMLIGILHSGHRKRGSLRNKCWCVKRECSVFNRIKIVSVRLERCSELVQRVVVSLMFLSLFNGDV